MTQLRILETALYATNLRAAREFYETVLGLPVYSAVEGRHVFFKLGNGMLLIFNPRETQQAGSGQVPPHGAEGPGHVAFAVPQEELEMWRERLQQHHVPIEKEVQWPGGGYSLYFRDPAGNSVEITTPTIWRYAERDFWDTGS